VTGPDLVTLFGAARPSATPYAEPSRCRVREGRKARTGLKQRIAIRRRNDVAALSIFVQGGRVITLRFGAAAVTAGNNFTASSGNCSSLNDHAGLGNQVPGRRGGVGKLRDVAAPGYFFSLAWRFRTNRLVLLPSLVATSVGRGPSFIMGAQIFSVSPSRE